MGDAFKGFVVLRLIGLLAVLVVAAAAFAIRSFVDGSYVAGGAFVVGGLACALAVARLVARRRG